MDVSRKWLGRWINDGRRIGSFERIEHPAPYFRKEFRLDKVPGKAELFLCGLGWHVLYVNGQKADDRVLSPVVTQYTGHVGYVVYDITSLLHDGPNAIAILLGNGWYNCDTDTAWHFRYAPWRDAPKLLCDLVVDGKTIVKSDTTWKFSTGPVIFDALRNGEYYDARLEMPGYSEPLFDDTNWDFARLALPPAGVLTQENCHPCKVIERLHPVACHVVSSSRTLYDFGVNISGHCRIRLKGKSGEGIHINYTEKIDPVSKARNQSEINGYVTSGIFQRDIYYAKGEPEGESWEPNFTYHGFRYAEIERLGDPEILDIEACFVHSAFPETGTLTTSDDMLNRLMANARRSFLCNFVGIPTDCPHREKNGWTGDAQIAAETGLWNFDCRQEMHHFLKMVLDAQRPSGQLPGIVPTGGWGYNWGAGIAWDALLFEYPWQIYRFYGDSLPIQEAYQACRRYLDFLHGMEENRLIVYGLGDWMHVDHRHMVDDRVFHTAYYCYLHRLMSRFAGILGKNEEASSYEIAAEEIRCAWEKNYYFGDGNCAGNEETALALPLYFDLIAKEERVFVARRLAEKVRANQYKIDFGFFGAKFVPRVLADTGYADDAFRLFRQEEYPGWMWAVRQGATSFWESWNGMFSQNHCAFCDVLAWMYQYLAGLNPDDSRPGFRHFILKPNFVTGMQDVTMQYKSIHGLIVSHWHRNKEQIRCRFEIPDGSSADIILPDRTLSNVVGIQEIVVQH